MTNNFKQKTKSNLSCRTRSGIQAVKTSGFRLDGRNDKRRSFTLIELLVVLALVAILSVVVILTLNPAELLKQARDSNRLSDLATINTALNLFSTDVTSGFMGTSTIVYVSLPSTTSNCSNLGLPSLPTGYTYNCVTNQNLRNTDGTGWIPVNFQRISSNSPISQLPVDPINTTSTRLYYTYVSGGSWELNASIEASKNKLGGSGDLVSKDGGSAASQYEIGNNLNLNPVETGDASLVGYWNFEEGPNATSSDRSGYGNHGTWYGSGVHYATGKVGSYAGQFNGSGQNDYVNISNTANSIFDVSSTNSITASFWASSAATSTYFFFLGKKQFVVSSPTDQGWGFGSYNGFMMFLGDGSVPGVAAGVQAVANSWDYYTLVYSRQNQVGYVYKNGALVDSMSISSKIDTSSSLNLQFGYPCAGGTYFNGYLDDIRIYNRPLSSAEVLALYNAAK